MKDYFEHIDDYMEGTLSAEKRSQFEQELTTDSSLKAAVNNYHEAKKLSEGLLELDMMDTLSKLQATENKSPSKSRTLFPRKWLLTAASLAVLLISGWWFNNNINTGLDKEQLLSSYIKPIDQEATKSIDTLGMNAFEKGKYYFALNRFEESEQWLMQYLSKEKNKKALSAGYYWLGAAHLEQWEVAATKKAWKQSEAPQAIKNLTLLE